MEMHITQKPPTYGSGLIRIHKPDRQTALAMNGVMPQLARYLSSLLIASNYTFQYLTP
jgi:hypothetical protein